MWIIWWQFESHAKEADTLAVCNFNIYLPILTDLKNNFAPYDTEWTMLEYIINPLWKHTFVFFVQAVFTSKSF